MCLILVAWCSHPHYPLVVAANRDEFFSRRTARADFLPDHPQVLAGRDIEGGGTWMGITRSGRFAALTNYRDPSSQHQDAPSRGALVADFLGGDDSIDAYLARIVPRAPAYNGFNLLLGDMSKENRRLVWFSNVAGAPTELTPGVYGVSNHLLDSPWPKVGAGKTALAGALSALPDAAPLFDLLRDDGVHPDEALPRTGVSLEWERLLSSAFVRAPGYGTRNSTVLTLGADGWANFDEQTWLEEGRPGGRAHFRFALAA
ncbi:MAG: NRDE family protein [Sulfurisoma sp.]|nr:NRDE family protein [Sulfurisoma sp.]